VMSCDSAARNGNGASFDLVLLVPRGDTSSILPCFGSQGCRPEGVGPKSSGLNVVRGGHFEINSFLLVVGTH
jgi:hypothetical protein